MADPLQSTTPPSKRRYTRGKTLLVRIEGHAEPVPMDVIEVSGMVAGGGALLIKDRADGEVDRIIALLNAEPSLGAGPNGTATTRPVPPPVAEALSLEVALAHIQRIQRMNPSRALRLVIRRFNPVGLTAHQTTEVAAIHAGFDWEAGQLIIEPARPLTELSPADVDAIRASARAGQSWHAYQREERRVQQLGEALGVDVASFADALTEIRKLRQASPAGGST